MFELTRRERAFTLIGIMVGLFLGALDQTIVGTAMPKILQQLNGLNLYTWVVTAYLLVSTSMIPVYGKLSDLYGRKIVLLVGIALFLAGSALSGQARSMVELIAFRAVQGLGSAGIFSTAFTVIGDIFPPAERGKYQGLFGAVFGIASVVGPWLGGVITDNLSWRWVFYVNVPIGLLAGLFIILQMPALRLAERRAVRIDWLGTLTLLFAVVPILLALSLGGSEYRWGSWLVVGLFALGAVGLALFILVERRAAEPILPFDLFANRTYVIGNAAAMLIAGVAFFGAVVFLPVFMVLVVGVSSSQAGLTVTPLTFGVVAGSFIAGQLVSRLRRYKLIILVGIAIVFAGYLLMRGITVTSTQWDVTWRMVILGLGLGPALPVFVLAVQNAVDPRELGAATSSSQFFRQIGATVGIAVFGTVLSTTLAARLDAYLPEQMQQMSPGGGQFNTAQLQAGNLAGVGEGIRTSMDQLFSTIERALRDNDAAAARSLLDNPLVPGELKDTLRAGGIAAQVRAGLRGRGQKMPAAEEAATVAQLTDATLAGVRKGLDARAAQVTADVTTALKKAFTDAITTVFFWGMLVVVAGFLITLFLPELALRERPAAGAGIADGG